MSKRSFKTDKYYASLVGIEVPKKYKNEAAAHKWLMKAMDKEFKKMEHQKTKILKKKIAQDKQRLIILPKGYQGFAPEKLKNFITRHNSSIELDDIKTTDDIINSVRAHNQALNNIKQSRKQRRELKEKYDVTVEFTYKVHGTSSTGEYDRFFSALDTYIITKN